MSDRLLHEKLSLARTALQVIAFGAPDPVREAHNALRNIEAVREPRTQECRHCLAGWPKRTFNKRVYHELPDGNEAHCSAQGSS
jgi:hypothetical protein